MKTFKILCVINVVLTALLLGVFLWIRADSAAGRADFEQALSRLEQEKEQTAAQLEAEHELAMIKAREEADQEIARVKEEAEQAAAEAAEKLRTEHEQAIEQLKTEQAEYLAQFKLYKNIISQDEVAQTLFGQPISEERNGEYRIGVKTAIDGDFHAELTIYQAKDGAYEAVFTCPAVVGKNGPGKQSEGDTKTPLGTWTIGEAYGILDDPGSLLPYTKVTEDMYWCATGSNGKNYNRLLYKSDDPDADYSEDEHLIDYPVVYNYLIDLGYNAAGAPYAGNAIFLHCWRGPDSPTGGCVGVSEESMVTILQTVIPGTSVTIY